MLTAVPLPSWPVPHHPPHPCHPHQTPSLSPFRANVVVSQIQVCQGRVLLLQTLPGQGLTGDKAFKNYTPSNWPGGVGDCHFVVTNQEPSKTQKKGLPGANPKGVTYFVEDSGGGIKNLVGIQIPLISPPASVFLPYHILSFWIPEVGCAQLSQVEHFTTKFRGAFPRTSSAVRLYTIPRVMREHTLVCLFVEHNDWPRIHVFWVFFPYGQSDCMFFHGDLEFNVRVCVLQWKVMEGAQKSSSKTSSVRALFAGWRNVTTCPPRTTPSAA